MRDYEYHFQDYTLLRQMGADFGNKNLAKYYKQRRKVWESSQQTGPMPEATILDLAAKYQPVKETATTNGS